MSRKHRLDISQYSVALDISSLFLAVFFLLSVIKYTAMVTGAIVVTPGATEPVAFALIIGLILVFINWYKSDGKISVIAIVALTILLSSAAVWMFGLHPAF